MTEYIKRKWRRMNLLMRALVSVVTAGCICSVLIVVASPGDTDEDGMSDDYETFFGLNYTNAADASQNNDDDTLLNLAESSLYRPVRR